MLLHIKVLEQKLDRNIFTTDMLLKQSQIIQAAYETQLKTDEFHIAQASFNPDSATEYPINSYVLVEYPTTAMGRKPPTKLHTNLKGPMRVINFIGSNYTLQDLITNKNESVHIKRIRPFYYDPRFTDPIDIARRDYQSTVVEKILSHSGNTKRVSELDFLVKWLNVPESGNLWLPWNELRNNPVLHQYLTEQNLTKLIPKEHRTKKR